MPMELGRRSLIIGSGAAVLTGGIRIRHAEADAFISQLPRNETLIVADPTGTVKNAGWFNIWVNGGGGIANGLQQLGLDTLWYIDPEHGIDNIAWDCSLAADKPQYNKDFTEMTVKLRDGLLWSDGVPFTADDVVATVQTQIAHPGMLWGAQFTVTVAEVTATDPHTVLFKLKQPNSRFHSIFTVRWQGAWILPKHIFEKVEDPLKFNFTNFVTLGAYTVRNFDPNGNWFIWERRADWQRTSLGRFGEPGPRYVVYVAEGPTDERVIQQSNHNLDIVHDLTPEGAFALLRRSPESRGWLPSFPYAHPDPTLPAVILNNENPIFHDRPQLRWALALLIDIRTVAMASYRGAATISAIGVPPTGVGPKYYHEPIEGWLNEFTLDTGTRKIKPYNPHAAAQIADFLRPSLKSAVPTDPAEVAQSFGRGWWTYDPQAATELLQSAGCKKMGGQWHLPDGTLISIPILVEGEARPSMTSAGSVISESWREFGIDSRLVIAPNIWDRFAVGDYVAAVAWSVETWGGHPDLSFFLDSWHSEFLAPPGKTQSARNWQRWSNPELDQIIDNIRKTDFDDPKGVSYGLDYVKLAVREMPTIPLMAFNVFTMMDQTYWTGYPEAVSDPYTDPVPDWGNSRYMMPKLKPRKA
jgi:peptide/nickel transport system substrate-binding protein